jgi:hypothetical protein
MTSATLPQSPSRAEFGPRLGIGLRRATLLLLGFGLGWRVLRYALCFPFWGDEAYLNINYLHRGFAELATPLEYSQISPIGFLWLQRAVYAILGGGEYALRLMPLLAGITALLLFSRLAHRALSGRAALLATAIFAASYYLVRHTCESKPYAMDLLAGTLLLWLGESWLQRPASARRATVFAIGAAGGVWLSYPAIFVAGGVLVVCGVLALQVNRRAVLTWLAAAFAVSASFACFYLLFAVWQCDSASGSWLEDYWRESFPPLTQPLACLWWLVKVHTGRMFAYPTGGQNFASAPITFLCLIGAITLWRSRQRRLLALFIVPALLTLLAAALRKYPYGGSARVALHLAPAICLAAGAGLATLLERLRRPETCERVQGLVLGGLLVFIVGGAVRDTARPFKEHEDIQARAVMRRLAPLFPPSDGVAAVNPLYGSWGPPEGPKFEQTLRYYYELHTGRRLDRLSPDPAQAAPHWLLAYRERALGPTREFVETQLARRGLQISSTQTWPLSGEGHSLTVYQSAPLP